LLNGVILGLRRSVSLHDCFCFCVSRAGKGFAFISFVGVHPKEGRKEGTEWEQLLCLVFFGAFCGLITLLALDSSSFLRFSIKNISYRPISHIIDMLASDYCLLLCFLFLQFYRLILRVLPYKDRCWYSRCIAVSLNYWLVARLAFLRRQLTATGKRRDDDTTTIV